MRILCSFIDYHYTAVTTRPNRMEQHLEILVRIASVFILSMTSVWVGCRDAGAPLSSRITTLDPKYSAPIDYCIYWLCLNSSHDSSFTLIWDGRNNFDLLVPFSLCGARTILHLKPRFEMRFEYSPRSENTKFDKIKNINIWWYIHYCWYIIDAFPSTKYIDQPIKSLYVTSVALDVRVFTLEMPNECTSSSYSMKTIVLSGRGEYADVSVFSWQVAVEELPSTSIKGHSMSTQGRWRH